MRYEYHNLDGKGKKKHQVYDMPVIPKARDSVTDVPCPVEGCTGTIRWHEYGWVPGHRLCDGCGRHFQAKGGTVLIEE
jgi:hypothetical protein